MKKLKDRITDAYARANSMSESQKKLNSLIMKLSFKKTSPYLIGILATMLLGFGFDINPFITIAIELILCVILYKKTKKISNEFNDFRLYQGNVINIQSNNDNCTLVIKQGKMPVKLEINYLIEDFKNLKKNELVRVGYNKDKKIAMLYK